MSKARGPIPCLIHIPGTYPDGREIEPETLEEFLQIFDRHFGGCTQLGIVPGRWLDDDKTVNEPMHRIEVAVKKKDIPKFEKIARQIGKRMKQKVMYVVINYQANVKFLFTDEDEEEPTGTDN